MGVYRLGALTTLGHLILSVRSAPPFPFPLLFYMPRSTLEGWGKMKNRNFTVYYY